MSVKAVQPSINSPKYDKANQNQSNKSVAFTGYFNPVVTLMDAIDRGGFAASFIAQDGIGMVAPRIHEGLNRNRKRDPETGKHTGPYNWEFARREGLREVLSGPSAFLIPAAILAGIKKYSGTANNVPVNLINAYGENFAKVAGENTALFKDAKTAKTAFYKEMFTNMLDATTQGGLHGKELEKTAEEYTQRLLKIEAAKGKNFFKNMAGVKVEGSKQDLIGELVSDISNLNKKYNPASTNEMSVKIKVSGKEKSVSTSAARFLSSIGDYTDDAIKSSKHYIDKNVKGSLQDFIKNFNLRRTGTRVMSNFGMWLAVVGFYTLIPKLYNLGIKKDPGLAGLEDENCQNDPNCAAKKAEENKEGKKDVAFTGGFQTAAEKTGKKVLNSDALSKISSKFEFNGPSMSVPAMTALLFGFCFPPRYMNAKSDHERKEIVFRDLLSFSAILFGAKALSRATSNMFSKITGLALNIKPQDHGKSVFQKIKNYFTPGEGINVLSSDSIVHKYSNLEVYKDGARGFVDFLEENGGSIKKVLKMDKKAREAVETMLGKKLSDGVGSKEIKDALLKAEKEGSKALKDFYGAFAKSNNKFVNIAKTCNSAFGFLSTLVLVPAFMIWVARTCENMTKKRVAKEKAEKAAANAIHEQVKPQNQAQAEALQHLAYKPSMAGFLGAK